MDHKLLHNEDVLLRSVSQGDETAYTLIFKHYSAQVFNAAMIYLKDEIEAREVVQDVFLKVWLKRAALSEVESFKNYLFILVRNHVYDNFRRIALTRTKIQEYAEGQIMAVNDTDHPVQDKQYQNILQKAIGLLPEARKKVYLARIAGTPYEEIAVNMNISVHTVKKQMQLASQFIRSHIAHNLNNKVPLGVLVTILSYAVKQSS